MVPAFPQVLISSFLETSRRQIVACVTIRFSGGSSIAEVQTAGGKLFLFVGIDRTARFAVAQLVATADRKTAWEFLQHRLDAVPYQERRWQIDVRVPAWLGWFVAQLRSGPAFAAGMHHLLTG